MIDRTVAVTITGALALTLVVVEMVRRRRLKEEYSLLWLLITLALVVLASSRGLLAALATAMGIAYPPSALIVVGFGFLTAAMLHFSGVVSRLGEENTSLAQEIAILRWKVHVMEGKTGGPEGEAKAS